MDAAKAIWLFWYYVPCELKTAKCRSSRACLLPPGLVHEDVAEGLQLPRNFLEVQRAGRHLALALRLCENACLIVLDECVVQVQAAIVRAPNHEVATFLQGDGSCLHTLLA